MFNNSLVVIDEVHNLISTIVNNRPKGLRLYELLLEAKNLKIVLLTGTPIINYPHEIAIISNILRGLIIEYTIKITRTPMKFSNYLNMNKYNGVLYYNNELEQNEWLEMIKSKLEKHNYKINGKINETKYKALPDERDEFNKFFIDNENNSVKNHILFKKRISGLVSYYSGASQELYP